MKRTRHPERSAKRGVEGTLVVFLLLITACAERPVLPFTARAARANGELGWFAMDAEVFPQIRDIPLTMRRNAPSCAELRQLVPPGEGPVWVLVHGIGGVGPEWTKVQYELSHQPRRAVFHYRWLSSEPLGPLSDELAIGIGRLLQCLEPGPLEIRVFAHSAGGVIASKAASRIAMARREPAAEVKVMTVASPLGGLMSRDVLKDPRAMFFMDLGSSLRYLPPSRGVTVTHLRTVFPGDSVMRPAPDGHRANEPLALVPTATVYTLSDDVSHVGALLLVAQHLGDGDFEQWSAPFAGLGADAP